MMSVLLHATSAQGEEPCIYNLTSITLMQGVPIYFFKIFLSGGASPYGHIQNATYTGTQELYLILVKTIKTQFRIATLNCKLCGTVSSRVVVLKEKVQCILHSDCSGTQSTRRSTASVPRVYRE